MNKST